MAVPAAIRADRDGNQRGKARSGKPGCGDGLCFRQGGAEEQ